MVGIVDESTAVTASSLGIAVASGTTAHTKGSWVTLIASTSEETYWVTLTVRTITTADTIVDESFLFDIGVGATPSVVLADVPYYGNNDLNGLQITFPLTIASGAKVSMRCQDTSTTAKNMRAMIKLSNDDSHGTSTTNETIGADTSASKGTPIDPGATANTKPTSYTELSASTGNEYNYFIVFAGPNDNSNITASQVLFDVAIGATSSEVNQITNEQGVNSGVELPTEAYPYWHTIASGSRVSMRAQCSITNAADRLKDYVIIGFAVTAPAGGGGLAMLRSRNVLPI